MRRQSMNTAAAINRHPEPTGHIDLMALKARQQSAWSSGDYAVVGTTLEIVGGAVRTVWQEMTAPGPDCQRALDVRSGHTRLNTIEDRLWNWK
jgi:hypothetical protein